MHTPAQRGRFTEETDTTHFSLLRENPGCWMCTCAQTRQITNNAETEKGFANHFVLLLHFHEEECRRPKGSKEEDKLGWGRGV